MNARESMANVSAIARRELHSLFFSALGYGILTAFLFFTGFVFYFSLKSTGQASLADTVQAVIALLLVIAPLLTMRLLSEEYRSGIIETLLTAPVTETQVILGKYLGAFFHYLLMLVPTLIYVLLLEIYGKPDLGTIIGSYAGLVLCGAAFIALGLFCSALTRNQIFASIMALVLLVVIWTLAGIGRLVPGYIGEVLTAAGTFEHLRPFWIGLVSFRDVCYFITCAAFWLFLAVLALSARRAPRWPWRQWLDGLLALPLLVLLNAIIIGLPQTYSWSLDLTAAKSHSLAPLTRNTLAGFDKDASITLFQGSGVIPVGRGKCDVGDQVRDLILRIGAASSHLSVRIIDADRDKTAAAEAARKMNVQPEPDSVVLFHAGRAVQIRFSDMFDMTNVDPAAQVVLTPPFIGEEKIASALVGLMEEKPPVAYFVVGHRETDLSNDANSLGGFASELRRANYRVETLNLSIRRPVPSDADLLVIAGPREPFEKDELSALHDWLAGGGKLLLFAIPRQAQGTLKGLDELLREYNVNVLDDQILMQVYNVGGQEVPQVIIRVQDYGNHPIVAELKNANVVLQECCPISTVAAPRMQLAGKDVRTSPYSVIPLLKTGTNDVSEKAAPGSQQQGVFNLAVVVERAEESGEPAPRLVVVGSVSIATGAYFDRFAGNRAFVMNSVNWLTNRETRLGIPPAQPDVHELLATPSAMRRLFYVSVVIMPLASACCGIVLWFIRRSR